MKFLVTIGTRPEALKMAPVIAALRARPQAGVVVCLTGQHPDMAREALAQFGIRADHTCCLTGTAADLSARFAAIHQATAAVLARGFDGILVHGDTSSTFAAALAAFHCGTPVAHVEAGLRTGDLANPWPEEGYRRMVAGVATTHFAPTERARQNLLREGIAQSQVVVTGNTIVDGLLAIRDQIAADTLRGWRLDHWRETLTGGRPHVLVTAHRRENQGAPMHRIATAIARLARAHPGLCFVLPLHPNPEVSGPLRARLTGVENIRLIAPLGYDAFVYLMSQARLILSDSGGIQEEAPTFGVPVLVLRDCTERPEAVEAGVAHLVGTDVPRIIAAVTRQILRQASAPDAPRPANPFGDGQAAQRIADALLAGAQTVDIGQSATTSA